MNKKSLKQLVRPNIWNLEPYKCARNEFSGEASLWLDANESPYNEPLNRYPDPLQRELKAMWGKVRNVSPDSIFFGVGSDECIDLCYRVFCEPHVDNVVAIAPTYGMYQVCADINAVEYRKVLLDDNFNIVVNDILDAVDDNTKVIWICSPNNPTGNAFSLDDIKRVYNGFDGILVVDEAYIDFSSKGSILSSLSEMPNLIVMQTMSKAWQSAGVRLGIAYASTSIIDIFNKVKYPYNINFLTQQYAISHIEKGEMIKQQAAEIVQNGNLLAAALQNMPFVSMIYPSDANFLLVKTANADKIYDYLCKQGIITRNRNKVEKCAGCLRITIGTKSENDELIAYLSEYSKIWNK